MVTLSSSVTLSWLSLAIQEVLILMKKQHTGKYRNNIIIAKILISPMQPGGKICENFLLAKNSD